MSSNQDNSKDEHILSITFLISHNLKYGSGTQQVILNYLKAYKNIQNSSSQNKLKITILNSNYTPGNVSLLSDDYISQLTSAFEYKTIRLYHLYFTFLIKSRYGAKLFRYIIVPIFLKFTGRFVYRRQIDQISSSSFVILIDNDLAFLLPAKRKAKVLGTAHSLFEDINSFKKVTSNFMSFWKFFNGFIFLDTKDPRIRFCNKPYFILPNGVDVHLYYPRMNRKANSITRIIFFGRLSVEKGILNILKIWDNISHKELAEFHVAGDGPLKNILEEYKSQNYYFHGKLTDDEIVSFIQEGDLLLYPSIRDNFPLVVLEALSCGLFCMISESLKGVFSNFETFGAIEYLDPLNIMDISNAIDKQIITKQYEKLDRMKLHTYIKENYSWESIFSQLIRGLETFG